MLQIGQLVERFYQSYIGRSPEGVRQSSADSELRKTKDPEDKKKRGEGGVGTKVFHTKWHKTYVFQQTKVLQI